MKGLFAKRWTQYEPNRQPVVAVAVTGLVANDMNLLKWAIKHLVTLGSSLYLIHVSGSLQHIPSHNFGVIKWMRSQVDEANSDSKTQMKEVHEKYKCYCNDKQVKPIFYLLESDSIGEALVDRIIELGITKIVIGSPNRTIKGETADYVKWNVPDFVEVFIINTDESALGGTDENLLTGWSEENESLTGSRLPGSFSHGAPFLESPLTIPCVPSFDLSIACSPSGSPSGSRSPIPHGSHSQLNGFFSTDQSLHLIRSPFIGSSSHEISFHESPFTMPCSISIGSPLTGSPSGSHSPISHGSCSPSIESFGTGKILPFNGFSLARSSWDMKLIHSSSEKVESEAVKKEQVDVTFTEVGSDSETLEQELDIAVREMEEQSTAFARAQEVLLNARRMVEAYNAQRREEAHLKEEALKELEVAKQQCSEDRKKQNMMEKILEASERKRNKLKILLHHKTILCEEGGAALHESKRETEMAQQQARQALLSKHEILSSLREAEKKIEDQKESSNKSFENIQEELEKTKKRLETEIQLREDAEEKVLQEQKALSALREDHKIYTRFGIEEIREATNSFSEYRKIGEFRSGCFYKGTIRYTAVAIKFLQQDGFRGSQEFQKEVDLMSRIHHPHVVMLLGTCPEKACIVYEYMPNGSLKDCLFKKPKSFPWYIRFQVCYEVASALMFLHSSQPEPIFHSHLELENILLDQNFVSKISDIGVNRDNSFSIGKYGLHYDVYAFGIVILQILTGLESPGINGLVQGSIYKNGISKVLDKSAGDWPVEQATSLALIGLECVTPRQNDQISLSSLLDKLKEIQIDPEIAVASEARKGPSSSSSETIIPSVYQCPITQEVMEDPHIAADGYTYEHKDIRSWLSKHDTSPMTNLRLEHKNLMPNRSLKSAISEWESTGRDKL